MRDCNCSFITKKGHSSNGWMQMELRINPIPVKNGTTATVCFKET